MGAWGTAVFSDDVACEVRDLYRELLAEGYAADEVNDAVLQQWAPLLSDVDAGPVIWLALAVTQWKLGRLNEQTRASALEVIESGAALAPWRGSPRSLRQRKAVLLKVNELLRSPQPPARKPKKRFRNTCDWERGELISYRLRSGRLAIFRVVGYFTDRGGTSPVVEVLDYVGDSLPSAAELEKCPVRRGKVIEGIRPIPAWELSQILIGRLSEKELPKDRVDRLGILSTPTTREPRNFGGALWQTLDARLLDVFGIE